MAIPVGTLRTQSMIARHRKLGGLDSADWCLLCRKPMGAKLRCTVAVDYERFEFVTDAEAVARGDAVSLFDVGKDCSATIARALSP